MEPVMIRSVALKGASGPFRPFKMPVWAPPGQQSLFNEKRMGEKKLSQAFSASAIPLSLGIGLGSAAAILIGSSLKASEEGESPSVLKPILIGLGLAGLGFSIWNLFSKDTSKSGGLQPEGGSSGISPEEVFKQISGRFVSPKMYEETSYWTNADANLVLSNPSSSDSEFILIVEQFELERSWYDNFKSTPQLTNYNYIGKIMETPVTVKKGSNLPVHMSIDSDTMWPTAIKLVASKLRKAGEQPVKMAEVVFFG